MLRVGLLVLAGIAFILASGCMDASEAQGTRSSDEPRRPEGFDLQGHRGARGLRPENTLPAFRHALELGVSTLEMDVVISADSQVVVSHDPWMSSVICTQPDGTPVAPDEAESFNLYAMSYEEIARFDCGQRSHPDFPEQQSEPGPKPLLRDVLQMAETFAAEHDRGAVFYNIETKSRPQGDGVYHPAPERFTRLLYAVLGEAGVTERATIQSFDPRTLQVARRLDPSLSLALLVGRGGGSLQRNVNALGFTPTIYSPNYRLVNRSMIRHAHEQGMEIIPWTVNTRDEMERLQQLGVDGLITDYPNRALFLIE